MPNPTSLTLESLAQISALIQQIETLLPDAIDLTATDRLSKRKIGPANAFVIDQMAGVIRQTTSFLPRDFDDVGFLAGADEQARYTTLEQNLTRLMERVTDTRIGQGDLVMKQADMAYGLARKHQGVFIDESLKKVIEKRRRETKSKTVKPTKP
jgi:hypothetical protein